MRLLLNLTPTSTCKTLPANYQYPLSAIIYRIIAHANTEYASFLHDKGYGKGFKLFCFANLITPFKNEGDRLLLTGNQAKLTICFHLPQAAENFIRGLFINQQIEIADKKSKVSFQVTQVETVPSGVEQLHGINELLVKPISPMVCGVKNEKDNYIYLSPEDERFTPAFIFNWKEKYKTVYGEKASERVFAGVTVELVFNQQPPKSRLITIKADTPEETKIRGFVNFNLKIKADITALELLLNVGAGLNNSLGMGCVEKNSTRPS